MKRFIILLSVCMLALHVNVWARGTVGVLAGVCFSNSQQYQGENPAPGRFTGGFAVNVDLPAGFTIQPAVQFVMKQAYFSENSNYVRNVIEVPVSFQWGPDLMICRPFLDVTPYAGLMIGNDTGYYMSQGQPLTRFTNVEGRKRFEYGLGVGGGIDVWRLRFIARYFWNFGSMFEDRQITNVSGYKFGNDNFKGLTLTMAFFLF